MFSFFFFFFFSKFFFSINSSFFSNRINLTLSIINFNDTSNMYYCIIFKYIQILLCPESSIFRKRYFRLIVLFAIENGFSTMTPDYVPTNSKSTYLYANTRRKCLVSFVSIKILISCK